MKNLIVKPRVLPKNGIGTVFLIAMIFFLCFSVQGKEHGEDLAPLPKIFLPLAWNTNLKEIKHLFPKLHRARSILLYFQNAGRSIDEFIALRHPRDEAPAGRCVRN